jgi:predicted nucleic acid-binding protein
LDTNVLLGALDGQVDRLAELAILRDLQFQGKVRLCVTSRFLQDVSGDPDAARRARGIELSCQFEQLSAPFRFDISSFDGPDHLSDGNDVERQIEKMFGGLPGAGRRTNDLRDADHLMAHVSGKGDYFLTCDKGILKKRDGVAELGIKVLHPSAVRDLAASFSASEVRARLEAALVIAPRRRPVREHSE